MDIGLFINIISLVLAALSFGIAINNKNSIT